MKTASAEWENFTFVDGGLINGNFETGDWTQEQINKYKEVFFNLTIIGRMYEKDISVTIHIII